MSLEIYYNVSTEQKEKETAARFCAYRKRLSETAGVKGKENNEKKEKEN